MFPEVTLEEWQKVRLGRAVRKCTEELYYREGGQDVSFVVSVKNVFKLRRARSTWLHS